MNFAIGVSGLRPKVLNRSSGIVEQCPQRKHSTVHAAYAGIEWRRDNSHARFAITTRRNELLTPSGKMSALGH
jgi:hypothetical protein